MKDKICEHCGSPIVSYVEDGKKVTECSYCGKPEDNDESK